MFSLLGGHWAVLRSVAWTTMIVERSASLSLVDAVRDTLSGENPCKMCKVIEKKHAEQKSGPVGLKLDKKLDPFVLAGIGTLPARRCGDEPYPNWLTARPPGIADEPPTPVPIIRTFA